MKWYRKLYIGETARKNRYRIVGKVRLRRPQKNVYLIMLAFHKDDLMDIYPANVILWRYFYRSDRMIIGIAKGYEEAVGLACHIVTEVYEKTGGFDIKSFIKEQNGRK